METNELYSTPINLLDITCENAKPSNNNCTSEKILTDFNCSKDELMFNKCARNNENKSNLQNHVENHTVTSKGKEDSRPNTIDNMQNLEEPVKCTQSVCQSYGFESSNINFVAPTESGVMAPASNESACDTLSEGSLLNSALTCNQSKSETLHSTSANYQEKFHSPDHCRGVITPAKGSVETYNQNEFKLSKENNFVHITNELIDLQFPQSDKSIVISNNNALPQAENIVASNYSLAQLKAYGSDESLNSNTSDQIQCYRDENNDAQESDKDSDSESSSSSSSTSIFISDSSDSDSDDVYENIPPKVYKKAIKSKNEMSLDDLPPIEDLKISIPEDECVPIGKVYQIVDQLVVVQSLKDIPAYDLETVLFLEGGHPLGKIFDVFGPVTEPYYCIRFNSKDDITEKKINLEQVVYCAPKTKYTNYVFLAQLMKLKGSDASWENDDECPQEFLEYSDDEQEKNARSKKIRRRKQGKYLPKVYSDPDEPARKRHFAYEKRMNERNLQLTAVRSCQSQQAQSAPKILWPSALPINRASTSSGAPPMLFQNTSHQIFGRPALFSSRGAFPNNTPFNVGPNMAHMTPSGYIPSNIINTHPSYFMNPNNFSNFPGPQHSPGPSRAYPQAGVQPPFFSNPTLHPTRAPGDQGPGNNVSRWGIIPVRPSGFLSPRLPPPIPNPNSTNNSPIINNNLLQNSCFPSQRLPPPQRNIQPPFLALSNAPFCPPLPSPPPGSLPPRPPPHSFNNPPVVNFNPRIPPPSQNHPFSY